MAQQTDPQARGIRGTRGDRRDVMAEEESVVPEMEVEMAGEAFWGESVLWVLMVHPDADLVREWNDGALKDEEGAEYVAKGVHA